MDVDLPHKGAAPAYTITYNEAEQRAISRQNTAPQFQDIGVWEKSLAEMDKQKPPKPVHNPQKKVKAVKVLDSETQAAEQAAIEEIGSTNWVGKLALYRDAHPVAGAGTEYTETGNNDAYLPRFSCHVVIHEAPLQRFGSEGGSKLLNFTAKKTAKQYAAKKTIDWLIENERMPSDGSIKFPTQKQLPHQQNQVASTGSLNGTESPTTVTWASQVPPLCHKLGINPPRYELQQATPHSPLCDVYADFGEDPSVQGIVGQVKNIMGKKKAKEASAKIVVAYLKDIERQRLAQYASEDQLRKRSLSSDAEGSGSKALKIEA